LNHRDTGFAVQGGYHEFIGVVDASFNPDFVGLIVFLVMVHGFSWDFGKEILLRMNGAFPIIQSL
jgi:hypothetical protein